MYFSPLSFEEPYPEIQVKLFQFPFVRLAIPVSEKP